MNRVFYKAVGTGERVRIYRYEIVRVAASRIPLYSTNRTLHKAGVYLRDVEPMLRELNAGSKGDTGLRLQLADD